jgi:hypothetical protein
MVGEVFFWDHEVYNKRASVGIFEMLFEKSHLLNLEHYFMSTQQ